MNADRMRTSRATSDSDARSIASKSRDVFLNELEQGFLIAEPEVEKSFALKDWRRKEAQRVDLNDISLKREKTIAMRTL